MADIEAETKPHSYPCENEAYCLNGGTCWELASLGARFCVCAEFYDGYRCAEKKVPNYEVKPAETRHRIFEWSTMLPVIVVVAAALVAMATFILIYAVARQCYTRRYKGKLIVTAKRSCVEDSDDVNKKLISCKDVSAQTSAALYLHIDVQCSGQPPCEPPRTRLIGCSATPEAGVTYLQVHPTRQSLDLEAGHSNAAHGTSASKTDVSKEPDVLAPGFPNDTVAAWTSPNDSNNNRGNKVQHRQPKVPALASRNSGKTVASRGVPSGTVAGVSPGACAAAAVGKPSTVTVQPNCCNIQNCSSRPDEANNVTTKQDTYITCDKDLYDSDPEATAL